MRRAGKRSTSKRPAAAPKIGVAVDVSNTTRRIPLSRGGVRGIVQRVLEAERVREGLISVTFVPPRAIKQLNRTYLERDALTDVIAFSFRAGARRSPVIGDVYICPAVALDNARAAKVRFAEELERLVVHGTLHVLGYDHPEGDERTRSRMWRKQEALIERRD